MPDPRFYETLGAATLGELARLAGARLMQAEASAVTVSRVSDLNGAQGDCIVFFADHRLTRALSQSAARACFISAADLSSAPEGCLTLVTATPQAAWASAADRLHRPLRFDADETGIHPSAEIEPGAVISAGAIVGRGASIGRDTHIAPGAVVGPGVAIGRGGYIGAGVSIGFALIGDGVKILAGARIGEAGFGAAVGPRGVVDIPQLGRVILQDNVTVGANSCIDRGAWDDTVVGENTKIDNLVQVAHNVRIGRNCVLAAYTGISGSVVIGDGCMFGGRAGVTDHINIGAGARIAAAAGVMKDVPSGESWGGYPARPLRHWMRETAWLSRLASGSLSPGRTGGKRDG